jgi:hypothetical protein
MPNRIIRDGFVDSEAVNALSDWAHRIYSNLLVKCDDSGRFDGRAEILRSLLFPLGTGKRLEDFKRAIEEMTEQRLVIPYEFSGKPFLQVTRWQRCGNAETARYPWSDGSYAIRYVERDSRDGTKSWVATSLNDGMPMASVSHPDGVSSESDTKTETETKTNEGRPSRSRLPVPNLPSDLNVPKLRTAWHDWQEHRAQMRKPITPKSAEKSFAQFVKWGIDRSVAAIEHSIAGGYQGIFEPSSNGKRPVQHSGSRWADKPYCPG